MVRARLPRLALLAGLALASCNNATVDPNVPTVDTPLTYQEYLQIQNQFLCTMRFKCCTAEQAAARDPMKTDALSCTSALNARINTDYVKELTALAQGNARYDAVQAAICLESLKSGRASCDEPDGFNPLSNACGRVIHGVGMSGTACSRALDCGLGLYCKIGQGMATGSCVAQTLLGDPCDAQDPHCVPGTACGPDGKCILILDPGAACNAPNQCRTLGCTNGRCDPAPTVRAGYCS